MSCKLGIVLECETKLSKLAAGLACTGIVTAGIFASPLAGAAAVPLTSSMVLREGIEEGSAGKVAAGALGLASTAVTAPIGAVAGLASAPLLGTGAGMAAKKKFADSDDDIADSDPDTDYSAHV